MLQPGHAGLRVDFRKRGLCRFSTAIVFFALFIWWPSFKDSIGSAGVIALAMQL
jgi:hypothetical protein